MASHQNNYCCVVSKMFYELKSNKQGLEEIDRDFNAVACYMRKVDLDCGGRRLK